MTTTAATAASTTGAATTPASVSGLSTQNKMSRRVKARNGFGKRGALRNRKALLYKIQGVTKPALRRLSRQGGVKPNTGLIDEETRRVLKGVLKEFSNFYQENKEEERPCTYFLEGVCNCDLCTLDYGPEGSQ